MTRDDIRPPPPLAPDLDSSRRRIDLYRDFHRDHPGGDWRNRPLPRLRRTPGVPPYQPEDPTKRFL